MKCPSCGELANKVVDSRLLASGEATRRRRECEGCGRRFTTYERVEEALPLVVKKDGRREPYERRKLLAGLERACQKRPVSTAACEAIASSIERDLQEQGEREVPSSLVGEKVMAHLRTLDEVAYIRFASVYKSFDDISEFLAEMQRLRRASSMMPAAAVAPPASAESAAPAPPPVDEDSRARSDD